MLQLLKGPALTCKLYAHVLSRVSRDRNGSCVPTGECLEAVSHELTFFPLPRCFELFGFDLMVDEDWRVWLLEANAEPDFGQVCISQVPDTAARNLPRRQKVLHAACW
jgi:Tubulin-tyrosine ligase family